MEVHFDSKNASSATTWVFKLLNCSVPKLGEAIDDAVTKGIAVGLLKDSRHIIVNFVEKETAQDAKSKLETILGKGDATKNCIESIESFDLYHGEQWGLVAINAPEMPQSFDRIVEEDDIEEEPEAVGSKESDATIESLDVSSIQSEGLVATQPDIFAMILHPGPKDVVVPSMVKALSIATLEQTELRAAMVEAGGPLSDHLEKLLFDRGNRHVQQVQVHARDLARNKLPGFDAIFWITSPPAHITVHGKPKMRVSRRVEWIKWKASKLNMELTLPVFMALFKQMTFHSCKKARIQDYKTAVELWQGVPLDWKALSADERNLIRNINEGVIYCYCKNCSRVLDPKATAEFCSKHCASNFCRCGVKFQIRRVTDDDRLELQQSEIFPLFELASMLPYEAEVALYQNPGDVVPKHHALTEKRKIEKCCDAVSGWMDDRWCKRCLREHENINKLSECVEMIRGGKVTWGHCHAADALEADQGSRIPQDG